MRIACRFALSARMNPGFPQPAPKKQQTVIGQLDIPEKTNEITAIRDFVRLLDVHGRLVTGDAAQCQRETAQVILDAKAD